MPQKLPSAETLISDCQDLSGELRVWEMGRRAEFAQERYLLKSCRKEGGVLSAGDVWGHRSHAQSGPRHLTAWRVCILVGKRGQSAKAPEGRSAVQETPGGEPPCQDTRERSPHHPSYPQAAPERGEPWAGQSGTSWCCGSRSGGQMTSVSPGRSGVAKGTPATVAQSSVPAPSPQLTVLSSSRSRYFSLGSRSVTGGRRDLRTR